MRSLHVETWPVVKDRLIVGKIEGPNPDWSAQRYGHDPDESNVAECMRADVQHGFDDDDCAQTLVLMLDHHLKYLPVTNHQGQFMGMVCLEDILQEMLHKPSTR